MARKKITQENITPASTDGVDEISLSGESVVNQIPEYARLLLKTFSNYPELLITPCGGVFTSGCKLAAAQSAILYKNPYHNA